MCHAQKKTEIAIEKNLEIDRIFAAAQNHGRIDLEALETAVRAAALGAGAKALEQLLAAVGVGRQPVPVLCSCGARMHSKGVKRKCILTLLGPIHFGRSMFQCSRCNKTRFPGDEALGVVSASRSPGVKRLEARFGSDTPFKRVSRDLAQAAGIEVSAKDVERVAESIGAEVEAWSWNARMQQRHSQDGAPVQQPAQFMYIEFDGTGVPMVPEETQGRKGKQQDGSAKTREAKLGCVFTQTTWDEEGKAIRDESTTSYVGAIETSSQFGWRIYDEATRRGVANARKVAVITDGAKWARNVAETHFPEAIHIVDFYHAAEHVSDLLKFLYNNSEQKWMTAKREAWIEMLRDGNVQAIIDQATALLPKNINAKKEARKEIAYLQNNQDRMQYHEYRKQHLFIGSGVIEAGCKHVIGQRFKQSGMEWTVRGANAILALRCAVNSNIFEDFWADRAQAIGKNPPI